MGTIRVLIVDDQKFFADLLERVIGMEPDLEVGGRAGTLEEARRLAAAAVPDVVLMDYLLPDGDGVQGTRDLLADNPALKIVMLTGMSDVKVVSEAIAAGCVGFLSKDEAVPKALVAIRSAYGDNLQFSPERMADLARQHPTASDVIHLTSRQTEIVGMLGQGMSIDDIAESLVLSRNTVRNHVQTTLHKLNAKSQLEAVVIAMREGLIDPPQ